MTRRGTLLSNLFLSPGVQAWHRDRRNE